jgi:uncharacterized phage protein gp47/JayE
MATSSIQAGTTPVCTITPTGISRPTLATVLAWVVAQFQSIYGSDVSLDSSTQDGEWVGLIASAIDDTNAMAVQAYNAFSPTTAQGVGLSSVVKINGLARLIPSYSNAQILIVGQAFSPIINGLLEDEGGFTWALPANVTIPYSGQIVVTAICTTPGAILAPQGTINEISNSQPGWQSAINISDATAGLPVEDDATLRQRQSVSTMNSSTAILQGVQGAIEALPGVARVRCYENEGNLPDANGVPGHCIAVVVDGGVAASIAATIKAKKGGCGTYGSASVILTDAYGIPSTVNYFPVLEPLITYAVTIKSLNGFTTDVEALIQNSLANWTNNIGIGNGIQWTRAYAAAYLFGGLQSQTFEIQSIAVARDGLTPTQADVMINFNEAPLCVPGNVSVIVSNP